MIHVSMNTEQIMGDFFSRYLKKKVANFSLKKLKILRFDKNTVYSINEGIRQDK